MNKIDIYYGMVLYFFLVHFLSFLWIQDIEKLAYLYRMENVALRSRCGMPCLTITLGWDDKGEYIYE